MWTGDGDSPSASARPSEPALRPFNAHNRLLAALPASSYAALLAHAELVTLTSRHVLYYADTPILHVYFPLRATVSLVTLVENGASLETALVGNEGLIGLPIFLGLETDSSQAIVQAPGPALRLPAPAFRQLVEADPALREVINRYAQLLLIQVAQSAVCNRMHPIIQRYARWLLMTHDRVGSEVFPLTQEFVAAMLGVRRAGVTVATGALERAGLIRRQRGSVTVLDRAGLEGVACECYARIAALTDRLLKPPDAV